MLRAKVEKVATFSGHLDCVYCLVALPESYFISAGADGIVAHWDINAPTKGTALFRAPVPIYALCYAQGLLVAGERNGGLYFYDYTTHTLLASKTAHQDAIFSIAYLPNKEQFVAVSRSGELSLWNKDAHCTYKIKLNQQGLRSLIVLPPNDTIVAGGMNGTIYWLDSDLKNIHAESAHNLTILNMAYLALDKRLITTGRDAHIKVWHNSQNVIDIVAHHYAIHALCLSPDTHYFATGSMDKTIKLWNAETFRLIKVVDFARNAAHTSSVNALLWLPKVLISASDDRQIFAWEIEFYES